MRSSVNPHLKRRVFLVFAAMPKFISLIHHAPVGNYIYLSPYLAHFYHYFSILISSPESSPLSDRSQSCFLRILGICASLSTLYACVYLHLFLAPIYLALCRLIILTQLSISFAWNTSGLAPWLSCADARATTVRFVVVLHDLRSLTPHSLLVSRVCLYVYHLFPGCVCKLILILQPVAFAISAARA